jgi:hypothetical protein
VQGEPCEGNGDQRERRPAADQPHGRHLRRRRAGQSRQQPTRQRRRERRCKR